MVFTWFWMFLIWFLSTCFVVAERTSNQTQQFGRPPTACRTKPFGSCPCHHPSVEPWAFETTGWKTTHCLCLWCCFSLEKGGRKIKKKNIFMLVAGLEFCFHILRWLPYLVDILALLSRWLGSLTLVFFQFPHDECQIRPMICVNDSAESNFATPKRDAFDLGGAFVGWCIGTADERGCPLCLREALRRASCLSLGSLVRQGVWVVRFLSQRSIPLGPIRSQDRLGQQPAEKETGMYTAGHIKATEIEGLSMMADNVSR